MRTLAVITALLSVAACGAPAPAVDERPALIAQRVAKLEEAKASGYKIAKFDCPAKTVSDKTAETMLLMWINDRTDLVDQGDLRPASDDMISAFQTCGANMSQIINEMERSDDLLMYGLAIGILQQGRGLT